MKKKFLFPLLMFAVFCLYGTQSLTVMATTNNFVDEEKWDDWESGSKNINFFLGNRSIQATVHLPGSISSTYPSNSNQFGVNLNDENYFFLGGDSSAVAFAIEGNGDASPYIPKPNHPNIRALANPNEIRSDYKYYYKENAVKEVSEITVPITGEKLRFTQIVNFTKNGIFHISTYQNIGESDIDQFRIINKLDTFYKTDDVPLYYGETRNTYYLRPDGYPANLRIEGLDGVSGSAGTRYSRLFDGTFINRYRKYNSTIMESTDEDRPYGKLAFSGDDSEIIYDQQPQTLTVGDIRTSIFRVDIFYQPDIKIRHVDESGKDLIPLRIVEGNVGQDYSTNPENIEGYTLKSTPENASGIFSVGSQIVTYIYSKNPDSIKEGTVNVTHVDEKGNVLAPAESFKGNVGEDYLTNPKDIAGYTLKESPFNANGAYIDGNIDVLYIYLKNPDSVKGKKTGMNYLKNNNSQKNKEKSLPQTGERTSILFTILGITILLTICGYSYLQKKS